MVTISVTGPETCAHCCGPLWRGRASTGRLRVYCSDYSRKAAWGVRRKHGAVAVRVEVVERVVVEEHNLAECSRRCCQSPVAATNMLYAPSEARRVWRAHLRREVETRGSRSRLCATPAGLPPGGGDDALLSIEDAAVYLNIPARSVGEHVRMRPEWLDDFIAPCERPVVAPAIPIQRGRRRPKL